MRNQPLAKTARTDSRASRGFAILSFVIALLAGLELAKASTGMAGDIAHAHGSAAVSGVRAS